MSEEMEYKTPSTKASNRQVGGRHYKDFQIQPAEFCHVNRLGFLTGEVVKRMCAYEATGDIEEIHKSIHELELLLEFENR